MFKFKPNVGYLPNIFKCTLIFLKEIHASHSWLYTKPQKKAFRTDIITRALIISRQSHWVEMKRHSYRPNSS